METIAAIENRRSIRKFFDKEIDKSIIEKIPEAGIPAPFGKNTQPRKYIAVTGENKTEMLKAVKGGIENKKLGEIVNIQSIGASIQNLIPAGFDCMRRVHTQEPAHRFAGEPLGR